MTSRHTQKKNHRLVVGSVVDSAVVAGGDVLLAEEAAAASTKLGDGLGAQTPAGRGTPGGCLRRDPRVSFWAVYRSAGPKGRGGFSSSQL